MRLVSSELESAQQVQQSAKGIIDAARMLSKNRPPLGLLQGIVPAPPRFVLRPPTPPATPTFSPREHLDSLNLRKGSREGLEAAFNARVKDPRLSWAALIKKYQIGLGVKRVKDLLSPMLAMKAAAQAASATGVGMLIDGENEKTQGEMDEFISPASLDDNFAAAQRDEISAQVQAKVLEIAAAADANPRRLKVKTVLQTLRQKERRDAMAAAARLLMSWQDELDAEGLTFSRTKNATEAIAGVKDSFPGWKPCTVQGLVMHVDRLRNDMIMSEMSQTLVTFTNKVQARRDAAATAAATAAPARGAAVAPSAAPAGTPAAPAAAPAGAAAAPAPLDLASSDDTLDLLCGGTEEERLCEDCQCNLAVNMTCVLRGTHEDALGLPEDVDRGGLVKGRWCCDCGELHPGAEYVHVISRAKRLIEEAKGRNGRRWKNPCSIEDLIDKGVGQTVHGGRIVSDAFEELVGRMVLQADSNNRSLKTAAIRKTMQQMCESDPALKAKFKNGAVSRGFANKCLERLKARMIIDQEVPVHDDSNRIGWATHENIQNFYEDVMRHAVRLGMGYRSKAATGDVPNEEVFIWTCLNRLVVGDETDLPLEEKIQHTKRKDKVWTSFDKGETMNRERRARGEMEHKPRKSTNKGGEKQSLMAGSTGTGAALPPFTIYKKVPPKKQELIYMEALRKVKPTGAFGGGTHDWTTYKTGVVGTDEGAAAPKHDSYQVNGVSIPAYFCANYKGGQTDASFRAWVDHILIPSQPDLHEYLNWDAPSETWAFKDGVQPGSEGNAGQIPCNKQVLAILDGDFSHIGLQNLVYLGERGVTMMCSPPYLSGRVQKEDASKSTNQQFKDVHLPIAIGMRMDWLDKHGCGDKRNLDRTDIPYLLSYAYRAAWTQRVSAGGLRTVGLVPFTRGPLWAADIQATKGSEANIVCKQLDHAKIMWEVSHNGMAAASDMLMKELAGGAWSTGKMIRFAPTSEPFRIIASVAAASTAANKESKLAQKTRGAQGRANADKKRAAASEKKKAKDNTAANMQAKKEERDAQKAEKEREKELADLRQATLKASAAAVAAAAALASSIGSGVSSGPAPGPVSVVASASASRSAFSSCSASASASKRKGHDGAIPPGKKTKKNKKKTNTDGKKKKKQSSKTGSAKRQKAAPSEPDSVVSVEDSDSDDDEPVSKLSRKTKK